MADKLIRNIFEVVPDGRGWAVESDGQVLDRLGDKEEARAAAHRHARASQDAGRPCMVKVTGDL